VLEETNEKKREARHRMRRRRGERTRRGERKGNMVKDEEM
jgi:hypothetical protein